MYGLGTILMFFKEDYNSELINKFYSEIKKNNDFNIDEGKVLWRNYKEIVIRFSNNKMPNLNNTMFKICNLLFTKFLAKQCYVFQESGHFNTRTITF